MLRDLHQLPYFILQQTCEATSANKSQRQPISWQSE